MPFGEVDLYEVGLAVVGLAALGAAALPRVLAERPLSFPIVFVGLGMAAFALPLGLDPPDPLEHTVLAERLTELGVIVALTGAGLKLDRVPGLRTWGSTWRLLAVTMPVSIVAAALLGWWGVGLAPAAAVLLGAVLAPTDPVLASDVQVGPPGQEEEEDEVRFSLTSEAGLNDGLAFPFTNAAVAMAVAGAAPRNWILDWLLVDVLYKVAVGIALGWVIGRALGHVVFRLPARTRLAETAEGLAALALTLVSYGLTELAGGYGFLAVFVAAVTLRDMERSHEYHRVLHNFAEEAERLLMAVLLVLLGGAVVGGLLAPLTWTAALVGLAFLFVVRPAAGLLAMAGSAHPLPERGAISFFGIRGIGSLYYLAFALNHAPFTRAEAEALWALVGFVVLVSVVVHGLTATPAMARLDRGRRAAR